jgi:murein L,D-transpeptidase YcbB/YkuD
MAGLSVVALMAGLLLGAGAVHAESSKGFSFSDIFGGSGANSTTDDQARQVKEKAERDKAMQALLDELTPTDLFVSNEAADQLSQAIALYQNIVNAGAWPKVPAGGTLKVGDIDEAVVTVRKRLRATSDLPPTKSDDWTFDENLANGVKHFQRRHGIPPTGVVDSRTVYSMNISAEDRLAQLQVSLGRMQEFLHTGLPDRFVMVNVAAMELQAVDDGRIVLKSRVIVGRKERPTPFVTAKIQGVNFYPFWKVPDTVANKDLIPKLGKDPDYFVQEHIRLFTDWNGEEIDPHSIDPVNAQVQNIRFRQDPGEFNALGIMRVDMPNPDDVYMHDTPLKDLFGRPFRNFSSGCVRVQRIKDLVTWLVSTNGDWDAARVESVLQSGFGQDVKLMKPIPVYFIYQTAWVDTQLGINFRSDLYARDGVGVTAKGELIDKDAMPAPSLSP